MCSLRRTVSVPATLCRPDQRPPKVAGRPRAATTEIIVSGRLETSSESSGTSDGLIREGVSCPSFTGASGVSQLWVTPGQCCEEDEEEENSFLSVLRRLMADGKSFAVTYDFRSCMPDANFTKGLVDFCQEHLDQWAEGLKSAALLVQENILEVAAHGPVAKFLRACPCPPGCPFVLCHSALMVEEFFQACFGPDKLTASIGAQFLSVIDVRDDPRKPRSTWMPRSKVGACLASLAPSPTLAEAGTHAQMLHVLPNGDTRVIQAPPQDVVVRVDSRRVFKGEWAEDEWALHEDVKHLGQQHEEGVEDLTMLAALAFDCPPEELQQIVGAHFHVGELAVDAESESLVRGCSSWRGRQCGLDEEADRPEITCAEGIALLIYDAVAALAARLQPKHKCRGLERSLPARRRS